MGLTIEYVMNVPSVSRSQLTLSTLSGLFHPLYWVNLVVVRGKKNKSVSP